MTKTTTQKVAEFHELFEHPIASINHHETLSIRQLRIKLLFEELLELAEAGDVLGTMYDLCNNVTKTLKVVSDGENPDKKEELDALCDLEYVLHGKILTSGLHEVFDKAFNLVHENNMRKAHESESHAQETIWYHDKKLTIKEKMDSNGKKAFLTIREDGKLIKPHNHQKVDLSVLFPKTDQP